MANSNCSDIRSLYCSNYLSTKFGIHFSSSCKCFTCFCEWAVRDILEDKSATESENAEETDIKTFTNSLLESVYGSDLEEVTIPTRGAFVF